MDALLVARVLIVSACIKSHALKFLLCWDLFIYQWPWSKRTRAVIPCYKWSNLPLSLLKWASAHALAAITLFWNYVTPEASCCWGWKLAEISALPETADGWVLSVYHSADSGCRYSGQSTLDERTVSSTISLTFCRNCIAMTPWWETE